MRHHLLLAAALTVTTAACSHQTPTPTPTSPSTPPVVPLSVADASKAALRVSDLPKGWDGGVAPDRLPTPGVTTQYENGGTKYDPAECRIVAGSPLADLDNPATAVRGQYFVRDPQQSVTELIYSWPSSERDLVQRIADKLPRCAEVNAVNAAQNKVSLATKRVPVPGLKDGIVLRFEISDPDVPNQTFVDHTGVVVRDGTVLVLEASSDSFRTDPAFARFLTKAVTRLDAVVG
jgi:hypothetical protein